ncbi:MAG: leucine-rich repeat protein, partial [Clostridia bacterium]|nr:leucine-rich repeat protein [Clostridia bacterium]
MKKAFLFLTILALCLSLCLVFASCDNSSTENNKPSTNESNLGNNENDPENDENNPTNEMVTVTFDTTGGSEIASVQVKKGENVEKPQDPQKPGYAFDGWYVDNEKWSFIGYTVTKDITLTAKWKPATFTIEYIGDTEHNNRKTYTINDEFELINGSKDYYEFFGWYEDESYTKPITKIEKGTYGDLKIYAKTRHIPISFRLNGDEYTVSGYQRGVTDIIIPSTYNGKPVTSIGGWAFNYCSSLTSIEIPNSVTSIGERAFYGCTGLTSIEIPNSVTSIGEYAFYKCEDLLSVTMGNGVTSVGKSVFYNCEALTKVDYLGTIEQWCNISFGDKNANPTYYANNLYINGALLTELVIPNTITSIGNYAFENCKVLTSIELPSSVTSIGEYAFYNCEGLISVTMGNGVTSIGNLAFSGCIG